MAFQASNTYIAQIREQLNYMPEALGFLHNNSTCMWCGDEFPGLDALELHEAECAP